MATMAIPTSAHSLTDNKVIVMIQGSSLHLLDAAQLDPLAKVLIAGCAVWKWLQLCGKSNAKEISVFASKTAGLGVSQ